MFALTLVACTPDVRGLYDEERRAALTVATERPKGWSPDLRVRIASSAFEDAVAAALKASLEDPKPLDVALPLGLTAQLEPRAVRIDRARVRPSDACGACLAVDAQLSGEAAWTLGPARGSFPYDVGLEGVIALEVADGAVGARPRSIDKVRVKVGDLGGLKGNPSDELQGWIRHAVDKNMPAIALADLGGADLPVRDLRLRTTADEIVLEALTDVPGARPVADGTPPERGMIVALSETALTGLARRAAFEQGVLAMDVAADPRSLDVADDRFTLGLRLWRLVGRGWWRDYEVTGTLGIDDGRLKLRPTGTREVAASPGAVLVDPLAALAQSQVLDAITDAVTQSLDASRSQAVGDVRLRAVARAVRGADDTLFVEGTVKVVAPGRK